LAAVSDNIEEFTDKYQTILGERGVTVSGGQTMNPSTEDILNAISKINAETVFVLPNNKNIIMAANQAATIASVNTVVIPTASIPEGIAAMQCFDQDLSIEEITEGMSEGAKTADTMQITYAARDSEFDGLHISAGEYLGLYGKKLAGNSSDINTIVAQLADMAAENSKEIITIYYGIDVTEEDAQAVADMFIEKFDEDSVMLIPGGQPVYYYIISAE
jgi:dihydroxyacetone kinase-like predicted kinase